MGLQGVRDKGTEYSSKQSKRKWKNIRSDHYSDEYRITPDIPGVENPHLYHDGRRGYDYDPRMHMDTHQQQRCCSQGNQCCSIDCCSDIGAGEIPIRQLSPPSRSPPIRHVEDQNRWRQRSSSSEHRNPGGIEVILVGESHVNLRRSNIDECSSCSTCDTCSWGSYTRVELKNNLFTSPMHSDQSLYTADEEVYIDGMKKVNLRRNMSPIYQRQASRSPKRRHTRSPSVEQSRRQMSPLIDKNRGVTSPSLDQHRRIRSPSIEQHNRKRSPSLEQHRRQMSPSIDKHRRMRSPSVEQRGRHILRNRSPSSHEKDKPRGGRKGSSTTHQSGASNALKISNVRESSKARDHSRRPTERQHSFSGSSTAVQDISLDPQTSVIGAVGGHVGGRNSASNEQSSSIQYGLRRSESPSRIHRGRSPVRRDRRSSADHATKPSVYETGNNNPGVAMRFNNNKTSGGSGASSGNGSGGNNRGSSDNGNGEKGSVNGSSNDKGSKSGGTGSDKNGTTNGIGNNAKESNGKVNTATTGSRKDLLNQMVSQTKEHRKQIRSLENELERLRSGDLLAKCEVSIRDVEWRPGDVVGEGSFSTVYRGSFCGTEVAVKELKFKLSQDDKNYFRSEAALLQQLHHPRVVLLMGVCTASARPFMLLEYLARGTLHNLIHSTTRERLDHATYFVIAKDIAQGMNYLHKHDPQVLHLDLKSMNVLLDSYTSAKIADFGFSILKRQRNSGAAQHGSIRGTPAWMAPELLTSGEVSAKCDVYSYAIILWEMLTAAHPFHGLDIYQIMQTVESGGRPNLPTSGVSRELRELVTSCWAQNSSLRPSFEEVLGALEAAAVPSSWRDVLQRAAVTAPAVLSDATAARAIIGMVEQSAEILRQSLNISGENMNIDRGRVERGRLEKMNLLPYQALTGHAALIREDERVPRLKAKHLSPVKSPQRTPNSSKPSTKKAAYRRGEEVLSPKRRPRESSNKSPERRSNSRYREEKCRTSPERREKQNLDIENVLKDKNRDRRGSPSRERKSQLERLIDKVVKDEIIKERRTDKHRSKSREKWQQQFKNEDRNQRERGDYNKYSRKSQIEQKQSRGRQDKERLIKEYQRKDDENTHHYKEKQKHRSRKENGNRQSRSPERRQPKNASPNQQRNNRERYLDRGESVYIADHDSMMLESRRGPDRLYNSRDSIGESPEGSWTSAEDDIGVGSSASYRDSGNGRSHSSEHVQESRSSSDNSRQYIRYHRSPSPVRHPRSPDQRRVSRSPQRKSKMRQEGLRDDWGGINRREPARYGPLILTAEQLLDQKQRLRPVRQSAFTDLDLLPQHSLNDISLLLKKAMNQRRDAIKDVFSGRETLLSEDLDWSDWH